MAIWWLNPAAVTLALVVPTLLLALWASPQRYAEAWRSPKWVDIGTLYLALPALIALVGGVLVGGALAGRPTVRIGRWPALAPSTAAALNRAFPILIRVTFAAYALWGVALVARGVSPGMLLDMVMSGDATDAGRRDRLRGVAGVTTFTQVGVVAVTIGAVIDVREPSRYVRRSVLILLVLAALRSYLLAERLALIELVIPWVVVRAAAWSVRSGSPAKRRLLQAAPLLAVPMLFVVFAGYELSRSWTYYSSISQQSYASFASDRLLGYYTTSYNNAQSFYDHYQWPEKLPYYSIEFFWNFPVVQMLMPYDEVTASDRSSGRQLSGEVLEHFNNPEFNSPNGLLSPALDFGQVGGALFLGVVGVVAGATYQSFRRGRVVGLLLYPALFVGFLDFPRGLYWTLGRTLPLYVALIAVLWYIGRAARGTARPAVAPVRSGRGRV